MITPKELDEFLTIFRKHNVMSGCLESGGDRIAVTLGPDFPEVAGDSFEGIDRGVAPMPGGWKTQPSDPMDPDPLGLGTLDMAPAIEPIEPIEDLEGTEL